MRHRGPYGTGQRKGMPAEGTQQFLKGRTCLKFSSICSHVSVGFRSRLLQVLPILIAS